MTDSPFQVVVTEIEEKRFAQAVRAGSHGFRADEPRAVGGEDLGPDPYGLLLAALGACTSMTVRMYARRKDWPLSRVEVRLSHARIHAEDCEDCDTKDGRLEVVTREVVLEGDLDPEQRARLMEIAEKCPVHRTLDGGVRILTREGET